MIGGVDAARAAGMNVFPDDGPALGALMRRRESDAALCASPGIQRELTFGTQA
jgi:hypothetical protein